MAELSIVDRSGAVPVVKVPRDYNMAVDFVDRNIIEGRGDKIAIIDDSGRHSYQRIFEQVNRAGNMLKGLGVQAEQRVLICLWDCAAFAATFYGALKIGAVPVTVNTLLTAEDYDFMLRDSRAPVIIISAPLLAKFTPILDRQRWLRHVVVADARSDPGPSDEDRAGHLRLAPLLATASPELEAAPTCRDDAGFWMYSSGTTGQPKGIVHAHSDAVHTAVLFGQGVVGVSPADVVFSAAKLFFAYGMGNALNFPFYTGATAVLMEQRPTAEAVHERLVRHQPTVFYGVPTLYAMMLARDDLDWAAAATGLRVCISAGEALPRDIGRRWKARAGVDILDGIGSTEMLQTFLSNRPEDFRYGTTGKPVPGYSLRLVDGDLQDIKDGDIGELLVRGPSMASCYWNQREKSRATFLGPWLRSGDKYFRDPDGYYVYAGRADDMLKVGGIWVSPFEVESALVDHQAVIEAAVIGHRDADGMVKPKAFVVVAEGAVAGDALAETLKAHVRQALAHYKYPRWIEFMETLPKTATGKIQRFKLRS